MSGLIDNRMQVVTFKYKKCTLLHKIKKFSAGPNSNQSDRLKEEICSDCTKKKSKQPVKNKKKSGVTLAQHSHTLHYSKRIFY